MKDFIAFGKIHSISGSHVHWQLFDTYIQLYLELDKNPPLPSLLGDDAFIHP